MGVSKQESRRSSITEEQEVKTRRSGVVRYVTATLTVLVLGVLALGQLASPSGVGGLPFNLPRSWLARVLARSDGSPPLKIYMYDMPDWLDKDVRAMAEFSDTWLNRSRVYDADVWVHNLISSGPFRTLNPKEADLFYIPIYPDLYLHQQMLTSNYSEAIRMTSENYVRPALEYLGYTMPYWKRMAGNDHFMTLSANLGRCVHFSALRRDEFADLFTLQHMGDLNLVNNDEAVLRSTGVDWSKTSGDIWPCYRKGRDILIPPFLEQAGVPVLRPRAGKRSVKTLLRFQLIPKVRAFWYARTDVRQSLSDQYENGLLPGSDWRINDFIGTLDDMSKAIVSIDPPGENPVNTRFWWTILRGCIPLSFRKERDLPFQDQLDYPSFNLNIDPYNANSTSGALHRLFSQPKRISAMQKALTRAQDALSYTTESGIATLLVRDLQQRTEKISHWRKTLERVKPSCTKLSDVWWQCW